MILAAVDPTAIAVAVLSGPLMAFGIQRLAKRADNRDGRAAALDARDAMLWQRMTDSLEEREREVERLEKHVHELEHRLEEIHELRAQVADLTRRLEER